MAPPVLVDKNFHKRRSATRVAVAVVTKDGASMRGFVLGGLACLAIVSFAFYKFAGF